ncbi:MAG: hypothetical protein QM687_06430 [Ferruginibacter sp.]
MNQLIEQKDFLKKYNIENKQFDETTLKWIDLQKIYADYLKEIPKLEASAIYIFNSLMKTSNVHSVRYRIKDAEHLIEKIIRKRIKDSAQVITIDNYKTELTDLIGLRALHLFKEEWYPIHELIATTWDLKEKPIAYYRDGDSADYNKRFEEHGCDIKEHPFGYRSVHYIVETKPAKNTYFAEIQVRTIFEEAWSEIDHKIRYPYDQENVLFGQFLLILNRLAGSADEMGTFIQFLKKELQDKENNYKQSILEKDKLIQQLEQKIKDLKLKEPDLKFLTEGLEKLKVPAFNFDDYKLPDMSFLEQFKTVKVPDLSFLEQFKPVKIPDLAFLEKFKPVEPVKIKTAKPSPKREE